MSDEPLFRDMDEPEEGNIEDIAQGEAALGVAMGGIGPGSGTNPSAPGPASGIGPAVGAGELGNLFFHGDDDDETVPRDA